MDGKGMSANITGRFGGTLFLVPSPLPGSQLCLYQVSSVNHWLPLCCQSLMSGEGTPLLLGYKP